MAYHGIAWGGAEYPRRTDYPVERWGGGGVGGGSEYPRRTAYPGKKHSIT